MMIAPEIGERFMLNGVVFRCVEDLGMNCPKCAMRHFTGYCCAVECRGGNYREDGKNVYFIHEAEEGGEE